MWLLPALEAQGLYEFTDSHRIKEGYYTLTSLLLTMVFMALCRIKNPEQLKQCSPGELGRLLGLDRIPEVKCLREKIAQLSQADAGNTLALQLSKKWIAQNSGDIVLYADGHVRIYNGYAANLPAKYVSRQKLCLSGTTEFWLNDTTGMPLMVWTGELSEKLQHAIEYHIVPMLFESGALTLPQPICDTTPPVCTLVFDREAWYPEFFIRLWQNYRIAVVTYRKHVKESWDINSFVNQPVTKDQHSVVMQLCEKPLILHGHSFREVRCLTETAHQTAIVTSHPTWTAAQIAVYMFNRWTQENFFKYQMSDYSFDHIVQYGTEPIDPAKQVSNPRYNALSHTIKKEKEKLQRLKAEILKNIDLAADTVLDDFNKNLALQQDILNHIEEKERLIEKLNTERCKQPSKITLAEMPDNKRYNKLKTQSRQLTNIIKMIAYRAETVLANMCSPHFKRAVEERRMLIKQIINTPASITPDYNNNTLTVTLHTLTSTRCNLAAEELAKTLNESETKFPGTNLTLVYKLA